MLVFPDLGQADATSWAWIVDMAHGALPKLDMTGLAPSPPSPDTDSPNAQT